MEGLHHLLPKRCYCGSTHLDHIWKGVDKAQPRPLFDWAYIECFKFLINLESHQSYPPTDLYTNVQYKPHLDWERTFYQMRTLCGVRDRIRDLSYQIDQDLKLTGRGIKYWSHILHEK